MTNGLFADFGTGLVRYQISGDTYNFYKRLTGQQTFDLYSNLADTWSSASNVMGTDFYMYSTYAAALAGTGAWTYCNYDDPGVGYPRDCGPSDDVAWRWTELHDDSLPHNGGGQTTTTFWVQVASVEATSAPTVAPSPAPTAAATDR